MKWLTETRATRRSLAEIGMLVVVREVFGNKLAITRQQADETLGRGWMALAKGLAKAGVVKLQITGERVRMSVVAAGDRRRERSRKAQSLKRAITQFERERLFEE